MDRILISPFIKNGKYEVTVNPNFLYIETSAWIDIFKTYARYREKIIEGIAKTIGNHNFRILVSVINFLELIGTQGDVSKNFSSEYLQAINNICMTSAHQPKIITDQEVFRFIDNKKNETRILDLSNIALKSLIEGYEQRKKGNIEWFRKKRKWWDEMNERDRVLNLDADIYDISGIISYPSFSSVIRHRDEILSEPIQTVKEKRSEISAKKVLYKGKKEIPSEEKELLKYAKQRINLNITERYGHTEVSMALSNPNFVFPTRDKIITAIKRNHQLTFLKLKEQLPGLYWQVKIGYYNYYYRPQRASGQLGDRNHAVYIPYSGHFATSDQMMVNALKSEYISVYTVNNLHLFKIK